MMSKEPVDGYQLLKDHPELVAAIERMANVKIIFEEEDDDIQASTEDGRPDPEEHQDRA